MPDTVVRGPYVDLIRQMGIQGVNDRYKVSGEAPACVCLLHGISSARVLFSIVQPSFGRWVGQPQLVVAVQVRCEPWCGYRLGWA